MTGDEDQPQYSSLETKFIWMQVIYRLPPSKKLSHKQLGPFPVERQVGTNAYHLKLPQSMSCLHPVFNVIKLSLAPEDPIPGQ